MLQSAELIEPQEGMIRTLHDTFYIKPLPSHVIKENEFNDGQAHVIYRRSIEDVSSECHFSGIRVCLLLFIIVVVVVSFLLSRSWQNANVTLRSTDWRSISVIIESGWLQKQFS